MAARVVADIMAAAPDQVRFSRRTTQSWPALGLTLSFGSQLGGTSAHVFATCAPEMLSKSSSPPRAALSEPPAELS